MPTQVNLRDLVKHLPKNVRDHLFSDELTEKYSEIFESIDITDEQAETARNLVRQVYSKQLSLPEFMSATGKELKLSDDAAKKLSVQIIGFDFLPIADYLGVDVERYLKELGVDTHVFEKKVNPKEIAEELALNANLRFPDPQLNDRLKDIILNRLRNVRDDLETKTVLMRSTKLGGLELSEESASKVLELIQSELEALSQKKVILKEAIIATQAKPELHISPIKPIGPIKLTPPPSPTAPLAQPPITPPIGSIRPIGPISLISPIKQPVAHSPPPQLPIAPPPQASLPKPPIAPFTPPKLPVVQPALPKKPEPSLQPIGQISPIRPIGPISPIRPIPPQPSLKSKPGDILAPEEMEELQGLSHKVPRSGVNTVEIIARSLASIYEDANLTFDDLTMKTRFETIAANRLKDIRDSMETRELFLRAVNLGGMGFVPEIVDRVTALLDKEFTRTKEELHEVKSKEFQAQTRARQEEAEKRKSHSEQKEKEDLDSRWQRLVKPRSEKKTIGPIGHISPINPIKSAVAAPTSPQPQPHEPKPSLEDVKYTPKLVGPIEELKNFSIDDFRKLGAKSRNAAARLQDKLDVLRGESMEKKISGVQALKTSPLYKLYMSILAESLVQGKKPADIIAARRAITKETLSEEEFSAIMELSSALRY